MFKKFKFMEIFLDILKNKYADFNGRARRNEYWMFVLFNFIITLIVYALIGVGIAIDSSILVLCSYILLLVVSLVLFIPGFAVAVRRLHDTNRSGWFLLLLLIPFIGFIILIVFLITEGTRGPNIYGPDPKNPHDELDNIGIDELV